MGEEDNYVILQIVLSKSGKKDATLRINDGAGTELFYERVYTNEHVRYIKVSPDELKNIELVLNTTEGELKKRYNLNLSKVNTFKLEEVVVK